MTRRFPSIELFGQAVAMLCHCKEFRRTPGCDAVTAEAVADVCRRIDAPFAPTYEAAHVAHMLHRLEIDGRPDDAGALRIALDALGLAEAFDLARTVADDHGYEPIPALEESRS